MGDAFGLVGLEPSSGVFCGSRARRRPFGALGTRSATSEGCAEPVIEARAAPRRDHRRLAANTAQTVWQRLYYEHALEASIRIFRRYVADCISDGPNIDRLTVREDVTRPRQVAA